MVSLILVHIDIDEEALNKSAMERYEASRFLDLCTLGWVDNPNPHRLNSSESARLVVRWRKWNR